VKPSGLLSAHSLQVFDPAMCCSTGVCGPGADPRLARFAGDLEWLKSGGILVLRHNPAQNPAAFVTNAAVRGVLAEKGEAALPILLLNGQVVTTGRYPDRAELATLLGLMADAAPMPPESGCGGEGACCG